MRWLKKRKSSDRSAHQDSEHWISVSDLMAGLMMVFLFIAVALMLQAQRLRDDVVQLACAYFETKDGISKALRREFKTDLKRWRASIDSKTLSLEFLSPEVLFELGRAELKPEFEEILADFFPRYMRTIGKFLKDIDEIRIEGHTDSAWNEDTDLDTAYFLNMGLSQARTREVLKFVYKLPQASDFRNQIRGQLSAVGMSSSRLKFDQDATKRTENAAASRRVSFRIITDAEAKMDEIRKKRAQPAQRRPAAAHQADCQTLALNDESD